MVLDLIGTRLRSTQNGLGLQARSQNYASPYIRRDGQPARGVWLGGIVPTPNDVVLPLTCG